MVVQITNRPNRDDKTAILNYFINTTANNYVGLKNNDYELYCSIIKKLCTHLHNAMQKVDAYYKKYTKSVSLAGSHYDKLRVTKPDEFDIVFTVDLPLNKSEDKRNPQQSDIVIEPQDPGYVELKMGVQFENLPKRAEYEVNQTAYEWGDSEGYLLRSKFKDWFKKVVWKAFNLFESNGTIPLFRVKDRTYTIRRSEAGPAITLIVEDEFDFKMDVDLVPALRFPENRWPVSNGYRPIPPFCKKMFWLVVPKPNRSDPDDTETISRTWRIGLQYQEGALMYNKYFLKPTIRLIKKLRDTQRMDKIVSYHIKTLFFWEIYYPESFSLWSTEFWQQNPTVLFKYMVQKLHDALKLGEIDYFWNDQDNFLQNVSRPTLDGYCNILQGLLEALDDQDTRKVAEYILTPEEFIHYERRN